MTIEEIKDKTQYGDYNTLADMLGIKNAVTARAQFLRGNIDAHKAFEAIIKSRETLITEFKKEHKL